MDLQRSNRTIGLCPECGSLLCEYEEEHIKERICWNCGYYESDSQAFKECAYLFKNMVRKNPLKFMRIFLGTKESPNESLQHRKPNKEFTESL